MKKIISMVMAVIMTTTLCMGTVSAASTPTGVDKNEITASQISAITEVRVNGVRLDESEHWGYFWIDAAGRTQAPVRLLVENMGYSITYNNGVVTVPGGPNGDLVITIGDKNLKVGGSTVAMDTMAVTISGRTYVPLRFVAEALGATVSTEKWPSIDITTTFTPDRKINGVLTEANFMLCKNMMEFHDANLELFTNVSYSKYEQNRWVTYYETPDETQMILTIKSLGTNGYEVSRISLGGPNASKQYELIKAFLKDVTENPDAIWAKLEERDEILNKDRAQNGAIADEARQWVISEANKSYTIGNVIFTWDDNVVGFTINTKSN